MLLSEKDIQVEMSYLGSGKGGRKLLRCEKMNFVKEIDAENELCSQVSLLEELDDLVFQRFREGTFIFDASDKQKQAKMLIQLSDTQLIEQIYLDDTFLHQIVCHELVYRRIWDLDIYRIGLYGNELAKSQAIQLMKNLVAPS